MGAEPAATASAVDAPKTTKQAAPADRLKLSNYLGILRDDPDDEVAQRGLKALGEDPEPALLGDQPVRLLEAARQGHESKGELSAVALLVELEAKLVQDDAKLATSLWKELGRLRVDELLDAEGALEAYKQAQQLSPDDEEVAEAQKRIEQAERSWRKFIKRYTDEAEAASDVALKTSLYLRAAALVWQYNKKKGRDEEIEELLDAARKADPHNRRAVMIYELTLRERKKWEPLAELLLNAADHAGDKSDQVNFYTRAARTCLRRLRDETRAAACYERVLDVDAANSEAMSMLAEHFGKSERWDDLVAMYEQALTVRHKLEVEQGILLQIGMVHWRMRQNAKAAEPYFARLRKLDAAHPAVLDFYRDLYAAPEQQEKWLGIVADAQRLARDDKSKLEIALMLARGARGEGQNRERAIEAWKAVQRLEPGNREALAELKTLYRSAEKWNALTDVIKAEIEATTDQNAETKVALLRELLAIYRDRLHMDGMVVATLGRIVKLMPGEKEALAELAGKYENAGRYNDLINVLSERADALTDKSEQVDAYLKVARLWIERFNNHSQATAPLEKVLQLDPNNREALSQLKSIYEKKRAWKQLFEVLRKEKTVASDPAVRLANTIEMAKLAADRLQSHADAIGLWKEALSLDAKAPGALEALEKLAEGERDNGTLVQVLENQLAQADNDEARIRVLQKLALLHAERLNDPAGSMQCWRRILALEPKHGRALRSVRDAMLKARDWDGLEQLYIGVRDFEGLVDVLSHEADSTTDAELKIALSFRTARVFEEQVGDASRAVRSYERVLSADPDNLRAAGALAKLYEQDTKWNRLRAMLEVMLRGARSNEQRLPLLSRLQDLCLQQLRDGEAAFGYAAQAYKLAPDAEAVQVALEVASGAALAHARVVELYLERVAELPAAGAVELRRRVAGIALDRLGQNAVAVEQLRQVLKALPGDLDAMATLERIYRAEQRVQDLHGLLVHRLEHEKDADARWATLKELALTEEHTLADFEAASEHYKAMSDLKPDDREVLAARDRLAVRLERYPELAEVLEWRIEFEEEPNTKVELGARLGLVQLDKLENAAEAVGVLERVLAIDPVHVASVAVLERIAEQHPDLTVRVGRLLESVYEQSSRYDKLVAVLKRRLEGEKNQEEIRELRLRLAEISGSKLGDAVSAYGSLEAAFFEHPDDRSLWDRLSEVAARAGQQRALAAAYVRVLDEDKLEQSDQDARLELCTRAAVLYDQVLGQPEEAEPLHRRILAADPMNEPSFVALKELLTGAERWDELQLLYRQRITDSTDADDKLDLLLQLCFVFEEILDRPEQAIETYEQVLQIAPDHAAGRRTLEALYERTERWRDLTALLRGNLDHAQGYERVDLTYRVGELHETRLGEPGPAVDAYEQVLIDQPHHLRAQQALGRLLSVDAQRQRVAGILAPLYESQGAYKDLARVLEIQLEAIEEDSGKADLLMRIGELHEQRTRDMEAALSAYSRATEAEPANDGARKALERIAGSRDAFRRQRAQVLERAVERIKDNPALQSELLLELGLLLDEYLGDKDAAESAYMRAIELDPQRADAVLVAARALEAIHLAKLDHARLAQDIKLQVELENDPLRRGHLLVRLGDLSENLLDAPEEAIAAHQKRLEHDPADMDALRSLERLYERVGKWKPLVETLLTHAEVASEEQLRRALWRRGAALRDERLQDVDGAIESLAALLAALGPDRETLRALAALYERSERHAELLDTLQREEQLCEDAGERAVLQFRMAELMRLHTSDVEHALEYYDQVLGYDPRHAGCFAALESVMAGSDASLRHEAARLAAPRYEKNEAYERLLAVLEVLQDTDDVPEKLQALRQAAAIAETKLQDAGRAFNYVTRSVRAGIDDPSLRDLLAEADRLVQVADRYPDYVALLSELVSDIEDPDVRAEVHRRIARAAGNKLGDNARALEHYNKLLEEASEDREALDAAERLEEQAGNYRALIGVLKRKADLATDNNVRRALMARQAEIYEQKLEEPALAIEVLQELFTETPTEAVSSSLDRLYTAAARWADLSGLYEQQLDRASGAPVEVRYKLAQLSHGRLNNTEGALQHLRDALTDNPGHAGSIALLEAIMGEQGPSRAGAAEILEPIYLARSQWPQLTATLEARIESETDPDERKRLLTRLAQLCEDQLEDFDAAIDVYGRLFLEEPSDDDTWETLSRLAKVGGQWTRVGKLLSKPLDEGPANDENMARLAKYIGRIYVDRVANHHRAAQLFEKALAFDPTDEQAFVALEAAYRETASHDKLLQLYREQADRADGDDRRVQLLLERARIYRNVLAQPVEAIATYREVLEISNDDAEAITGVETLYTDAQDWLALAGHLRRRVHARAGESDEIALKLRLAEVLEHKLGDVSAAIEVYEDVVGNQPREGRAIGALERLVQQPEHTLRISQILEPAYRQLDQWKKLVAILEARLELLEDDAECVGLLMEIGELHEKRGRDPALAFHAFMRAMVREPGNDEARSQVDRLAAEMEAWNEHVEAYEAALNKTDDHATVTALLTTLARVHDEKRGDPRAAIAVYERLSKQEPDDPAPLDALESLHTMVGDWHGLVGVYERKVKQAFDVQERGELLRRMGSVTEELIGDRVQAIVAYERAIGEDDADELAYEALDRLYALERRLEDLAKVLQRRIELAVDPATRVEIGSRLGTLFDRMLHQPEQAIGALQRVLEDEPSNREALQSISGLFEREGMWPELLDNFSQQQNIAESAPERVALLHRSGEVLEQRMGDVDAAIDSYRGALELDSQHTKALDALVRIARLPEHRARAAEIAEPLLRAHGRYDDLVALIEGGVASIDDAVGRRAELQRLAELHEHSRSDRSAAFETLCRALDEDPSDDSVLADLERLARELGRWERLAEVLGREAGTTPDTTLGATLFRRLARIYEQELNDDARAIDAFVAAETRDDTPETLLALDRLYLRTERWAELLEVLDRRVATSADPAERTDLLLRLGKLHVERFDDGRGAFVAFKEILDQDPSDARALAAMEALGTRDALARDVLDVLDDSFRQNGALDRLAGLYDIRIRLAETDPERIRLLNDAARIWEDELHDPARALINVRRVFELDPSDDRMLDEVERLAEAANDWEGVRGVIDVAIKSGAVEGQRKRTLALRAAEWYRDRLGDPAAEERSLRWALEVDPNQLDVHERVISLLREPGREAELVAALRAASDADRNLDARKDRLREAAGLAERSLRDLQLAGNCLIALLDVDAKDSEALSELCSIRTTEGRFDEVVALIERRVEIENDVDERAALRMRAAEILDQHLNRPDRAVLEYQALLEELPNHAPAHNALEQLFERSERYEELLALLQRRLPQEGSDEVRADLHLRIAAVAEQRLKDTKRAIDELRTVLREQRDHTRALAELERLLEQGERHGELIALLNERATRAAEQGDRATELDRLRKIAALTEEKLGNPDQAVLAYMAVCERDPSDRIARQALVRLRSAGAKWADAAQDMRMLLDLLSGDALVEHALKLADLADRRLDDLQLAESALLRALEAAPDHPQALEQIKALYERTQAHDKLVKVLAAEEQRVQDSAQRVLLLNKIAGLYRDKLGDPGSAVGFLERAVALVPDDREALLQLCDLYIAAGRARDAIPVLEKIVASYGGRRAKEVATYQHRLGQAYEGLGEADKALEHFDAAFKIDLTNVAILRDLGRLCLQKGDLDRAQKTYRALLLQKLGPDSGISKADVYFYLGEISFKQNDKVKAKAMLERAIAEAGQHPRAKAMLEQL